MRRTIYFIFIIELLITGCNDGPAKENSMIIDLFNKWERVWHEGQYDLIPACVEENYIRHDQKGDRTMTRDAYKAEIQQVHKARPDIRIHKLHPHRRETPSWNASQVFPKFLDLFSRFTG